MASKYLIDFVDTATDAEIATYMSTNGCTIDKVYDNLNKVYLVTTAVAPPASAFVTSIINDSETSIQLLSMITPTVTDFPSTIVSTSDQKQWWKVYSMGDIDVTLTDIPVAIKGQHSTVYVVDSGIDQPHPEFAGADVELLWSFTGEYADSTGHGTALASVIVGKTCSLNQSKLKVVKIFDAAAQTKQSDLLSAFDAIITDYLLRPGQSAIVNLSWSIPKNQYIEDKISFMINAGLIVVVAAGNSGIPIEQVTPASMPEVLTMGAYNVNFVPCNFSNYTDPLITSLTNAPNNGGMLDGWAPGENIWVAKPGGGYGFTAGTSIASAIQSAAVAYNMVDRLTSEFNIVSELRNATQVFKMQYMQTLSLTRHGLLILTDPKYVKSVNRVTTFGGIPGSVLAGPLILPSEKEVYFAVGKNGARLIVEPSLISSIELLDPLPVGISIELPFMIGEPTTVSTSGIDSYTVRMKITPKDPASSPIDTVWTIKIVSTSYVAEFPLTDPTIKIHALASLGPGCATTGCASCHPDYGGYTVTTGCTSSNPKSCVCWVTT